MSYLIYPEKVLPNHQYEKLFPWKAMKINNNQAPNIKCMPLKWFFRPFINCILDKSPEQIEQEDLVNLIAIDEPEGPQSDREAYLINKLKDCIYITKRVDANNISVAMININRDKLVEYINKYKVLASGAYRIYRPVLERLLEICKPLYGMDSTELRDRYLNSQTIKTINTSFVQRFPKLYRYQELNVEWIKNVENNTPMKFYLPHKLYYQISPNSEMYFTDDLKNGRGVYKSFEDLLNNRIISQESLKGGIFADEMGTGKTAVMITHILSLLGKEGPSKDVPQKFNALIPIKATLIVVPSHIIDQWIAEFEKFKLSDDSPAPKIVRITGKNDFEECNNKIIEDADIVITHYNFFNNPVFAKTHDEILSKTMPHSRENYRRRGGAIARRMLPNYYNVFNKYFLENPLTSKEAKAPPLLYRYYWARVVLDEGHDFLGKINALDRFHGKYKWVMTGTPMFKINESIRFLSETIINVDVAQSFVPFWHSFKDLNIMRRNTQQSTAHEINLNRFQMKETTVRIRFNVNEALVYQSQQGDNRKIEFLRKFCCYPFLPDDLQEVKTLDKLLETLHKKERDEAKKLLRRKNELEEELATLARIMPNDFNRQFAAKRRSLELTETHLNYSLRRIKFFEETLIPTFKNNEDIECPCCMCPVDTYVSITICGHFLCSPCMERHKKSAARHLCPTCKGNISRSNAVFKAMVKELEKEHEKEEIARLNKYGSKVKAIILKIREIMAQDATNAIIIFAEWDHILHTIVNALKKEGINVVYCKGNITSRTKAINNFALEKTSDVICLSSEYASHGTNLTRANKIMFVHPVGKDLKTRQDIEEQAIARAKRIGQYRDLEIIRFVIRNSIEEDIYKATH